jgi:hypothetical protein
MWCESVCGVLEDLSIHDQGAAALCSHIPEHEIISRHECLPTSLLDITGANACQRGDWNPTKPLCAYEPAQQSQSRVIAFRMDL